MPNMQTGSSDMVDYAAEHLVLIFATIVAALVCKYVETLAVNRVDITTRTHSNAYKDEIDTFCNDKLPASGAGAHQI